MTADLTTGDERANSAEKPLLLLFCEQGQNRRLLVEMLGESYRIEATTETAALWREFDCCLLTRRQFADIVETVRRRQSETPAFLPFLLLTESSEIDPDLWEYVDDIVTLPVKKAALRARVENLVERRRTARTLEERERQLQSTVDDLLLKEQAIDEAPVGFTIADARTDDDPLVYVNNQFLALTGYTAAEVLGRNCRFLQGEETDPETVEEIRQALDDERPVSVDIVNYRKNGRKFWNRVEIAPVRNDDGETTHFVGFQTDITDRKIRERRQEVLNRVLSHNFRNKMNVIEAYLEILRRDIDGSPPEEIEKIERAVQNLLTLSETARKTDRILSQTDSDERLSDLGGRLQQLATSIRDRYPAVTVELTLPEGGVTPVAAGGLLSALEEALDNAAKHNDSDDPRVTIRVTNRDGWVDIEIEDNGPGIPARELDVLRHGEEALRHADRMGIWLIYWTVTRAGGRLEVAERDGNGSLVTLSVPADDRE